MTKRINGHADSPSGEINWDDAKKLAIGALLAAGGAAAAYCAEIVIPELQQSGSPAVLALAAAGSVLLNLSRKWLSNY